MKKYTFLAIVVSLLFSACATTKTAITYIPPATSTQTDLSYDEVWSKVIDFFAESGTPITTIDKTSGLIVASRMSFNSSYTTQNKDGSLADTGAYVLIPGRIRMSLALVGGSITGDWNVRIKTVEAKTSISVNLQNIKCIVNTNPPVAVPAQTTGVFESQLLDFLK